MTEKTKWLDFNSWHSHGIERGFNKTNPKAVSESTDLEERRWYESGCRKKWINIFDFNRKKRKAGLVRDLSHVIREAKTVMQRENWNHFPGEEILYNKGYASLANTIRKDHEGFPAFRKKLYEHLGKKFDKDPKKFKVKDFWASEENAIKEANEVKKKLNVKVLPSCSRLEKEGFAGLCWGIRKHHGGFGKFRLKLEETSGSGSLRVGKYPENWKSLEYTLKRSLDLINKEDLEVLPSKEYMIKNGYRPIAHAIEKHHGGFIKYRTIFNEKFGISEDILETRVPNGSWKRLEFAFEEAIKVMDTLKCSLLPTDNVLREKGYSSLSKAIERHHGGHCAFRRKLNEYLGKPNEIETNEQFTDFLKKDESALNLVSTALVLNGESHDIEQLLSQVYQDRFKDAQQVHTLLQENQEEVYGLIQEGITNLGTYIGNFSLQDKTIIPILLGRALDSLSNEKITSSLEDKILRIFRNVYGPKFNQSPQETLDEVTAKALESQGKVKAIYQRLEGHYISVLELGRELN